MIFNNACECVGDCMCYFFFVMTQEFLRERALLLLSTFRTRKLGIFLIKLSRDFAIHYHRFLNLVADTDPILIFSRARDVPIASKQFEFLRVWPE